MYGMYGMFARGIDSLWNSQSDSQMYTFPDKMNWQFVQILMVPNSSQNVLQWTQMM